MCDDKTLAENFLEPSCTTEHAPGLQCSPSKRGHLKGCLEELDGRTPKLVRLDNEDEGNPMKVPLDEGTPFLPNRCNCPYFNFLLRIIAFYLTRGFAHGQNNYYSYVSITQNLQITSTNFQMS